MIFVKKIKDLHKFIYKLSYITMIENEVKNEKKDLSSENSLPHHHYSAWEYYNTLVWELEKALKEWDYKKYQALKIAIKNVQSD